MKMLKRVLAGVMTAALVLTSAVGVFAAGSRTKNVTVVGDDAAYYKVDQAIQSTDAYKALKTSAPEITDIIDEVNSGRKDMDGFAEWLADYLKGLTDDKAKESAQKVLDSIKGMEFATDIFDLIPVGDVKKNANGNYEVTLNVPSLTKRSTDVKALHYSDKRHLWEVIDPKNVDLDKKTVTVEFEDLSPVAIIAKQGTVETTVNGSQTQGTSPKTEGVSSVWMMWIGAAFVLAATGSAVVYRKKNCQ